MQPNSDLKTVYDLACLDIGERDGDPRSIKEAFEQLLLYINIHSDEMIDMEHTLLYCETIRLYTLAMLLDAVDLNNTDEKIDLSELSRIVTKRTLSDYKTAKKKCTMSTNKFDEYLCARIERWKVGLMLTQEMFDNKMQQICLDRRSPALPLR